jgi:hypothetical protein
LVGEQFVTVVAIVIPGGCATNKPDMAWVRTDGRRIVDDLDLLKQGQSDMALCHANLDTGGVDQVGRDCMAKKTSATVRKFSRSNVKRLMHLVD